MNTAYRLLEYPWVWFNCWHWAEKGCWHDADQRDTKRERVSLSFPSLSWEAFSRPQLAEKPGNKKVWFPEQSRKGLEFEAGSLPVLPHGLCLRTPSSDMGTMEKQPWRQSWQQVEQWRMDNLLFYHLHLGNCVHSVLFAIWTREGQEKRGEVKIAHIVTPSVRSLETENQGVNTWLAQITQCCTKNATDVTTEHSHKVINFQGRFWTHPLKMPLAFQG